MIQFLGGSSSKSSRAVFLLLLATVSGLASYGVYRLGLLSLATDKPATDDTNLRNLVFLGSAAATVGAVIAALATLGQRRVAAAERARIGLSRERLNAAEHALENALRHNVVNATNMLGVGVTLPVRPVDGQPQLSEPSDEDRAAERPQHGALGLPELWTTTHARLGLYHDIATTQAKRSFASAQRAMWMGFILLVVFTVLALIASSTAGAIVAGGLGAVAAALAAFVSNTFVRSQEAAATHLRSYFDQPLELSRYLAAERVIADGDLSQEQRAEVLSALVQAMVAGPPQPQGQQGAVVVTSVPQQGA
ncbi:hypothetical protein [Streptomyces sp. NPDC086010]|uniref:hypothetical protein n=1 Tax=Streptomyces sp. NPDC086010 TaxID=3365745 RepID=UPI0037D25B0F